MSDTTLPASSEARALATIVRALAADADTLADRAAGQNAEVYLLAATAALHDAAHELREAQMYLD